MSRSPQSFSATTERNPAPAAPKAKPKADLLMVTARAVERMARLNFDKELHAELVAAIAENSPAEQKADAATDHE